MKMVRFRSDRLRGYVEHGWMKELSGKMGIARSQLMHRLSGETRWQISELNPVLKGINELRQKYFGDGVSLVDIDEILEFREVPMEAVQISLPQIAEPVGSDTNPGEA